MNKRNSKAAMAEEPTGQWQEAEAEVPKLKLRNRITKSIYPTIREKSCFQGYRDQILNAFLKRKIRKRRER